jgi:hypothetical protein
LKCLKSRGLVYVLTHEHLWKHHGERQQSSFLTAETQQENTMTMTHDPQDTRETRLLKRGEAALAKVAAKTVEWHTREKRAATMLRRQRRLKMLSEKRLGTVSKQGTA